MHDDVEIHGHVAPGFEPVRDVFEANFRERGEIGASFAAERDGETLVDLWAGHRDGEHRAPWERDTLTTVYSTTKGIAALCCAMLVDRGLLDYETPVSHYWPEFVGKRLETVTVGMLLSHQAGLAATRDTVAVSDYYEPSRINRMLLDQEPLFEPGSAAGYHAFTFGPLVGELFERVAGESLGRFLRREVCEPLDADFFVGLPQEEEPRVAQLVRQSRKPGGEQPRFKSEVMRLALTNPGGNPRHANTREWRAAEIPSANGQGNALGIARIYGVLAAGGSVNGVKLLSRDTLERAAASRILAKDLVIRFRTDWASGWMRNNHGVLFGPNPDAYGHSGYGGSFGCADPETRVGAGYVMNRMADNLVGDLRGLKLLRALHACLA
ncbi:MAG: serine hydrolase domain-containing protein [Myxococcota bacterium]|nr:serine hydrolase domain-containing protein [Myxococcota bacterium]